MVYGPRRESRAIMYEFAALICFRNKPRQRLRMARNYNQPERLTNIASSPEPVEYLVGEKQQAHERLLFQKNRFEYGNASILHATPRTCVYPKAGVCYHTQPLCQLPKIIIDKAPLVVDRRRREVINNPL